MNPDNDLDIYFFYIEVKFSLRIMKCNYAKISLWKFYSLSLYS